MSSRGKKSGPIGPLLILVNKKFKKNYFIITNLILIIQSCFFLRYDLKLFTNNLKKHQLTLYYGKKNVTITIS